MIGFGEAVRRFYGNYANADGRAQRSAYWWVLLYQLIIYSVLIIVVYMAEGGSELFEAMGDFLDGDLDPLIDDDFLLGPSGIAALFIMVFFALANFLPDIMLRIRRFHDLNQTGWLVLVFIIVGVIPGIGTITDIANFVWFMMRGTNGSNTYGPDPLGPDFDIFG